MLKDECNNNYNSHKSKVKYRLKYRPNLRLNSSVSLSTYRMLPKIFGQTSKMNSSHQNKEKYSRKRRLETIVFEFK